MIPLSGGGAKWLWLLPLLLLLLLAFSLLNNDDNEKLEMLTPRNQSFQAKSAEDPLEIKIMLARCCIQQKIQCRVCIRCPGGFIST